MKIQMQLYHSHKHSKYVLRSLISRGYICPYRSLPTTDTYVLTAAKGLKVYLESKQDRGKSGENDITIDSDPFQVARDIARVVNVFRDIPGIKQVVLGRLFKRY
jgi:hypothetical protein